MTDKQHWMISFVRMAAVLFALLACLTVLVYTPFYSKFIVFLLNRFTPVEVNTVAARSQQMAALSEHDDLEPGSDLWVARQAYLKVMQEAARRQDAASLNLIQARYDLLQSEIKHNQEHEDSLQSDQQIEQVIKHKKHELRQELEADNTKLASEIASLDMPDNLALMDKYIHFLKTFPVNTSVSQAVNQQMYSELQQENNSQSRRIDTTRPSAIVVLGGGLTLAKNRKNIVVNDYTRLRLETTLALEKQNNLPIVLSGVEAPYMQTWLNQHGVSAKLLENRSMNTCENTRFSSLLLQKKGGAPKVMLVTDEYHMPRTRRLFAMNGIATIPVNAPMPMPLTTWKPSVQNYDHSRRANYELLATIRDAMFGVSDCREVP
ncbi:YdcF family protein [Acinetobacter sp. ANC 3791]|uniref:YdcF family protein n=1 Tax=Acinetobacter sp. ANC 3791 TaxID=2529836 RepID=UPI00103F72B1|nr:YdcF family protein [Acinetobacter sp. ANC 3791]TCB83160.1 YdcF family protein [Acinetobacter sp. ANC 3791]